MDGLKTNRQNFIQRNLKVCNQYKKNKWRPIKMKYTFSVKYTKTKFEIGYSKLIKITNRQRNMIMGEHLMTKTCIHK